ncbi:hypothetical protein C882_2258 [Caenispirillum salinarum AK4]|uniref:Uncharacterized protein n=1 Tax=Caenispirillum salinarum AK4 TaxID=1238182 RepID=K9HD47_9PROT|nr:hypothetical protein C882_2258 [Caenispirillum salinarum AK4]
MTALVHRLAASAPVPVFAAVGEDGLRAVDRLAVDPRVDLVASPLHAALLLVVGTIRDDDRPELERLHDQLPHPRATVSWGGNAVFEGEAVDGTVDPLPLLSDMHRALMTRARPSEPDLLPNAPPNDWRGKGDFGQGGEGMMGGVPYGRPMPMTDDDMRDGLALDAYSAPFGPFLPQFPAGLTLDLTLQGDVIQQAKVLRPPYPQHESGGAAVALRHVARMLRLLGLPARAERVLHDGPRERLAQTLSRWGAFAAIPPGLGMIDGTDVRGRLRAWCAEAGGGAGPVVEDDGPLTDLLPGLEWHEAVLVLNSLPDAALRRLVPVPKPDDDQGEHKHEHHHDHHHHDHDHGHGEAHG